ncbi:MAG: putative photosynthetic complex assembly protein PuhE [Sphingomonas sp.]
MSVPPLLFALLMWFAGTAAVVWLDSRARNTFRLSFTLAGVAAFGALAAMAILARLPGATAAYASFTAAIVLWGWHEMGFLMGFVAGPSKAPCPPGLRGWARFRAATATVIHHEVALAVTALTLFAISWGQPNLAGPLAFLLLFVMRLSAKFNLFLGVPNLSDEVFPAHLAYLKSYFRKAPLNALFPFSLAFGLGVTLWAWLAAEQASSDGGAATGALLAALAFLGTVEHLFLVLPMRDAALWQWATKSTTTPETISSVSKQIVTIE